MREIVPEFFPAYGMVRLAVPLGYLHLWSPEFDSLAVQSDEMHDHAFDFVSTVLAGKLENVEYDDCGREIDRRLIVAGDSYRFGGPGRFHRSEATGWTLTYCRVVRRYENYRALSLGAQDASEPTCLSNPIIRHEAERAINAFRAAIA